MYNPDVPVQDSVVQERLIEKYMSLPNEIWDSVIQRATSVSGVCVCHVSCRSAPFVFRVNVWFDNTKILTTGTQNTTLCTYIL